MKKQQTTTGQGTLKAKSAAVQPPQDEHDDELQQTTMKQANSSSPEPTDSPPAGSKAASAKGDPKKTYPYTHRIEFLRVGKDENADRYLRWRVGNFVAVVSVASLIRDASDTYVRLQRAGVILAEQPGQKEFIRRVTTEASKDPTFDVAKHPGLLNGEFYFPDGSSSKDSAGAFYPDEQHLQTYRKFHRAGTRAGWRRVVALAQGNSRMILGLALACTGPVCGAFNLDPPGIQYVGEGGAGKTPLARIIAAIWGWDPDGSTRLGFGTSWKMKPGGLEVVAEAYNHTLIFLDEMSKATEQQVEFVMTIAQGQGTARMTELGRRIWCMPILSTANRSFVRIMIKLGLEFDPAYVDRLMDVPEPAKTCMLENLHGHADVAAFFAHACELAEANHGWAGYHFATKLAEALRSSRTELKQDFEAARQEYLQAAAGITSSWRNLVRVHGRFATIYASGCLAIRFEALPLTKQELLAALLTCERDHVAFIDQEVKELGLLVMSTPGAPTAILPQPALAGAVVAAPTPFDRLRRFINRNSRKGRHGFVDLRSPGLSRLGFKLRVQLKGPVLGYIADGEYWIRGDVFEEVAGGSREALVLKQELFGRGLLVTTQRDKGVSYVVKRPLPDGSRPLFVVVRRKPKQPSLLGHSLPGGCASVDRDQPTRSASEACRDYLNRHVA